MLTPKPCSGGIKGEYGQNMLKIQQLNFFVQFENNDDINIGHFIRKKLELKDGNIIFCSTNYTGGATHTFFI